jgi:hypothetical protein
MNYPQATTEPRKNVLKDSQCLEAVESGIFHTLCHHWPGELLKAHDQLALKLAAHAQKKDIAKKIEQIAVQIRAIALGFLNGFWKLSGRQLRLLLRPRPGHRCDRPENTQ